MEQALGITARGRQHVAAFAAMTDHETLGVPRLLAPDRDDSIGC